MIYETMCLKCRMILFTKTNELPVCPSCHRTCSINETNLDPVEDFFMQRLDLNNPKHWDFAHKLNLPPSTIEWIAMINPTPEQDWA